MSVNRRRFAGLDYDLTVKSLRLFVRQTNEI